MARERAGEEQRLELEAKTQGQKLKELEAEVKAVVDKAKAIGPDLIAALQAFGDQKIAGDLAKALSPLAILGGESVAEVLSKVLKDTAVGDVALKTLGMVSAASVASRTLSSGSRSSAPSNGPVG